MSVSPQLSMGSLRVEMRLLAETLGYRGGSGTVVLSQGILFTHGSASGMVPSVCIDWPCSPG